MTFELIMLIGLFEAEFIFTASILDVLLHYAFGTIS